MTKTLVSFFDHKQVEVYVTFTGMPMGVTNCTERRRKKAYGTFQYFIVVELWNG